MSKSSSPSVKTSPKSKSSSPSVKTSPKSKSSSPSVKTSPKSKSSSPGVKTSPKSKSSSPSVKTSPKSKSSSPGVKTSPKSKSSSPSVKTSPKSVISKQSRSLFSGLKSKFREDVFEKIMTNTFNNLDDWSYELMKETERYPRNTFVKSTMEFKWRDKDLIYLLKYLTNKQKVSDDLYNEIIQSLVSEIKTPYSYGWGEDDEEDEDYEYDEDDEYEKKELMYYHGVPVKVFVETTQKRLYYIIEFCAKKRRLNLQTLNRILLRARNYEPPPYSHIRFIGRLIKPEYYEVFDFQSAIYILNFCLSQVVSWYDTQKRKVYIQSLLFEKSEKDTIQYINLLLRKIYEITKFASTSGFHRIQDLNRFNNLYFAQVVGENPEQSSHSYKDFMKKTYLFIGNMKIQKLLQLMNARWKKYQGPDEYSILTKKDIVRMSYLFPSKLSKLDNKKSIKLDYNKFSTYTL